VKPVSDSGQNERYNNIIFLSQNYNQFYMACNYTRRLLDHGGVAVTKILWLVVSLELNNVRRGWR
jgi:hypothetical protein